MVFMYVSGILWIDVNVDVRFRRGGRKDSRIRG